MEQTVEKLESQLKTSQNVNTILSEQLDDLQQYGRRSCVIVEGIPLSENGTRETELEAETKLKNKLLKNFDILEKILNAEFDKCHRIGKVKPDKKNPEVSKQSMIVKFKSHSFRSKLFDQRKDIEGRPKKTIKLRVSLTKRRSALLNYAAGVIEHFPDNFHFAYSDPNGGLKFRMRYPIGGRYTFSFNSETDIDGIINKLDLVHLNAAGEDEL